MIDHWILIGLLAVTTYISRIIGVEIMAGREMSPALRLYFNCVPAAIISALLIKQIFVPADGQLVISVPVFLGCVSGAVVIKITKNFLPSVVIGVMVGLFARYFLI